MSWLSMETLSGLGQRSYLEFLQEQKPAWIRSGPRVELRDPRAGYGINEALIERYAEAWLEDEDVELARQIERDNREDVELARQIERSVSGKPAEKAETAADFLKRKAVIYEYGEDYVGTYLELMDKQEEVAIGQARRREVSELKRNLREEAADVSGDLSDFLLRRKVLKILEREASDAQADRENRRAVAFDRAWNDKTARDLASTQDFSRELVSASMEWAGRGKPLWLGRGWPAGTPPPSRQAKSEALEVWLNALNRRISVLEDLDLEDVGPQRYKQIQDALHKSVPGTTDIRKLSLTEVRDRVRRMLGQVRSGSSDDDRRRAAAQRVVVARRVADRRAADQRAAVQRVATQRAAAQRVATQRAADKRAWEARLEMEEILARQREAMNLRRRPVTQPGFKPGQPPPPKRRSYEDKVRAVRAEGRRQGWDAAFTELVIRNRWNKDRASLEWARKLQERRRRVITRRPQLPPGATAGPGGTLIFGPTVSARPWIDPRLRQPRAGIPQFVQRGGARIYTGGTLPSAAPVSYTAGGF